MPIPDIKNIRLPLLELTGDGKDWQRREASTVLAERLGLTEREKKELVPSGGQPKFHNRVQWAIWGLKAAGLLESPRRGYFRITERGRSVLNQKPSTIDRSFLKQFPEFRAALKPRRPRTRKKVPVEPESGGFSGAPEEAIESAYRVRRESLAAELLQSVLEAPPEFFERLVVDLLVQMGYGGSREEAGEAIGQSGDEGIDGRIKKKTAWGWTLCTFKRSGGSSQSADRRCSGLRARCKGSEPEKECSSLHRTSPPEPETMCATSTPRSF